MYKEGMQQDPLVEEKNPVVETFMGTKIRRDNYVKVKLNASEYKRLLKMEAISDIAVSKIIALSAQPCQICGNDEVHIKISLGLLSTRKQNSGGRKKNHGNGQ